MKLVKFGRAAAVLLVVMASLAAGSVPVVAATPAQCNGCQAAVLANEIIYGDLAANESSFKVTGGLVQGVSYSQNVIEVVSAGVKESIHITPTTTIDKHGETGSIADIRAGVHVNVTGVIRDGQRVAVNIVIK
jgi:hypothetical protein